MVFSNNVAFERQSPLALKFGEKFLTVVVVKNMKYIGKGSST
jgi:hypothetical protein